MTEFSAFWQVWAGIIKSKYMVSLIILPTLIFGVKKSEQRELYAVISASQAEVVAAASAS